MPCFTLQQGNRIADAIAIERIRPNETATVKLLADKAGAFSILYGPSEGQSPETLSVNVDATHATPTPAWILVGSGVAAAILSRRTRTR